MSQFTHSLISYSVTLCGVLQYQCCQLSECCHSHPHGRGKVYRTDGHSLPSHIGWSTVHFTTIFKLDFNLINRYYPKGSRCNSSLEVTKLFLSFLQANDVASISLLVDWMKAMFKQGLAQYLVGLRIGPDWFRTYTLSGHSFIIGLRATCITKRTA